MFAALPNCPRRSLLPLLLVAAIGCGESDVPKVSISGPMAAANPPDARAEQLLGGWIVGGDFRGQGNESQADDIASRMQQGIAQGSFRFEFKTGNRVDIAQGGTAPPQTGHWQALGSDGPVLSIQIVAPEVYQSPEPSRFDVVFHDQDHLTMQQADSDGLSFFCTRLR